MALFRKHRPQAFSDIIGQDNAVSILTAKWASESLPHVIMLSGPTGVGKTTIARIIGTELGCSADNGTLIEMNCADVRGIDSVRDIVESIRYRPLLGGVTCYILDEVVQLPGATQKAFLKVLEDPPDYVYFLLCTSDTHGLLPTFLGRCFQIALKLLSHEGLQTILTKVLDAEGIIEQGHPAITEKITNTIVKNAHGNARKALQMLEAALACDGEFEALRAVDGVVDGLEEKVEFLAKLLLSPGVSMNRLGEAIDKIETSSIETLRWQVLGYMQKVLCNPKSSILAQRTAAASIDAFSQPFFQSGKAGLALACFTVCDRSVR